MQRDLGWWMTMSRNPYSGSIEQVASALIELILWYSAAALVTFGVTGVVVIVARRLLVARTRRRTARAIDGFVAALASSDFQRADVEAGRLLRANDRERGLGRSLRHLPERLRRYGRSSTREHPPLECFDAHIVLRCGMSELTRVIHGPASLAAWFGVQRNPADNSAVIRSRGRVLHLQGLVERWQPEVGTLHTEARTVDGSPVRSHVTMREAMVTALGPTGLGVQVWVHVELPASRRGRRVLTDLRPAIEHGLQRLEAKFDPPSRR